MGQGRTLASEVDVVIDVGNGEPAAEFRQIDRLAGATGLLRPIPTRFSAPRFDARLVLIDDQNTRSEAMLR